MEVNILLEPQLQDIFVNIHTPEMKEEVFKLQRRLLVPESIVCKKEGVNHHILTKDICRIYIQQRKVFVSTKDDVFTISLRLQELENKLNHPFVRISQSEMINIDYVDFYSFERSGIVGINLKNGVKCYASRRFVKALKLALEK